MTHALHHYLVGQLGELVTKHSIVVFYDPREEFGPFFDDLTGAESTGESPIRVTLAEADVSLARYSGSYFELRAAVEPIAGQMAPEKLLDYQFVQGPIAALLAVPAAWAGMAIASRLLETQRAWSRARWFAYRTAAIGSGLAGIATALALRY